MDCAFCILISKLDKEYTSNPINKILYEDDLVLVKPALGMPVENYLIVIAKRHINGFAEFSEDELTRLEKVLNRICDAYSRHSGTYPVILEHGSLKDGRHPLSITHAHLHIIPLRLTPTSKDRLFRDLKLVAKENILELKRLAHKDYWLYRSKNRSIYMSHTILDAPRSCFIKIVAAQVGLDDNYEWRDEVDSREDLERKTMATFIKMKL